MAKYKLAINLKVFILIFLFHTLCAAQSESTIQPDSLSSLNLEQIEAKFYKYVISNKNVANLYAKQYLRDAKSNKRNKDIAKGLYFIIKSSPRDLMLSYSDTLIKFSKGHDYSYYPALAYHMRASKSYLEKKDRQALEDLLTADSILSNIDTVSTKYYIKQAIGLLKSKTGDFKGALKEYKEALSYFKKRKDWNFYGSNAFAAYDAYLYLEHIDSAETIILDAKKRLPKLKSKISLLLQMASGILNYQKGNFRNSIDTLKIVKPYLDSINDFCNFAYCDHYIGLSYLKLGEKEEAISHFRSVDSVFQENDFLNSGLRISYIELIKQSRANKDEEQELNYLKSLIRLDSLNLENTAFLKDNIYSEYEIPKLLERKEELILTYAINQKKGIILIGILSVLVIMIAVLYNMIRKNSRKKRKQYESIIEELKNSNVKKRPENSKSVIPSKDIAILSKAFENYVENKEFTNPDFNKQFINKDSGVNNHYIADYLRDFIGCSLTTFINNKRIELAAKYILENKSFKKYTMQAMGEEVGYKNAGTFKRAFKHRMGMTPLEFLKQSEQSDV